MRRILAALLACIVASPAWAGSATVNYNSAGSSPFRTTTDGSSNNIGQHTIWDSAAGANGWTIDATHSGWVGGPIANGSAPTQNPIWFAGWDGTDLRGVSTDASGHLVVVGTGTFAVQASVATWAGGTLGAMANYGTSPGAVLVPGVNAFVTNASPNGAHNTPNSPTVNIATDQSGNAYFTIAASQTAQVLGATGATGDYLGFCTIYPTSTSPGVLTVFDSTSSATNNAIAFAGGATSVSNLTPINIPVGAISKNGAWKVTTGANMVVTCNGHFT